MQHAHGVLPAASPWWVLSRHLFVREVSFDAKLVESLMRHRYIGVILIVRALVAFSVSTVARWTCGVCDHQTCGRKGFAARRHSRPELDWSLDVVLCGNSFLLARVGVHLHFVPRSGEPVSSLRAGQGVELVVDVANSRARPGIHVGNLRLVGLVPVLRPAQEEAQEVPIRTRVPTFSPGR